MFERFTEKARRTIFFARYEASQFGSPEIDLEHLLLGLLREDKRLYSRWIPKAHPEAVRSRIEKWEPKQPKISTSVDLPLSNASKQVLFRAKDEADRLNSKHISTEHLLLGLLHERNSPTTKLLLELGADLAKLRDEFAMHTPDLETPSALDLVRTRLSRETAGNIVIHGERRVLRFVLETVAKHRQMKWFWHKQSWTPRDAVSERKTGKVSLDLSLADDSVNFELLNDGWKKDHCVVCYWELFESKEDAEHGTGYTNGRDWVCLECYERFWDRPDFVGSSYSEIT
jgi:hypothetical protein